MGGGAKDRWHQLDDAIKDSNLPASDKAVFRCLLKRADWQTTKLDAQFTPTRPIIARKTGLSVSQVNYSVEHLERHQWLAVKKVGRRVECTFDFGANCTCSGRRHARQSAANWCNHRCSGCTNISATD